MIESDPVQGMGEYRDLGSYADPEGQSSSSAQPGGDNGPSEEPRQDSWPELAGAEVESLKRELEQHQREMDAVQVRVEAITRQSDAEAEAIRREGEAKAREIIQKANAEADLLQIRARVRAEETRAREVARLWSRLDSVVSASGRDEHAPSPGQETVGAAAEEPAEAAAPEMAAETSSADAEVAEPVQEEPAAAESQPAEETVSPEQELVEAEAAPERSEPAFGFEAQPSPEVRRYKVRGPLSFGSMVAIEQAAGRIPGVLSAKVSPSPDGGAILTVSTHDPNRTEQEIKQIPHLSWQLEEL